MFVGSLVGLVGSASAQLPADRVVGFDIHEDPGKSGSPVVLSFRLELKASAVDNESVGWSVQTMTVTRMIRAGEVMTWTDLTPVIAAPDGLWWIKHTDPQAPETAEFSLPPSMSGTAATQNPLDDVLVYELVGTTYDPTSQGQPYPITASLTYRARPSEDPEPMAEGESEPAEMPDNLGTPS